MLIMLSNLFENFQNGEGSDKWRPKTLFTRKDVFVFENVNKLGYKMPHFENTMTYDALKAAVKTVARFHAQSYIYEERKSKIIGMPFRIWSEFSEYLQEPDVSRVWRDIGRDGVIDYLKTFSKYKSNPGFDENIEKILPGLFEKAMDLMRPSNKYRNVVIHRDLWCNNIFIKNDGVSEPHALLVDFQTVVYSSPMLDLSSLIYMNTAKTCRGTFTQTLIDVYYETLSRILEEAGLEIDTILPKDFKRDAYNASLIFGITQASLIVPYTSFSPKWKTIIFADPVRNKKFNYVSRSEDYIEIANDDPVYKHRVTELLDELVEHFVYPHKK